MGQKKKGKIPRNSIGAIRRWFQAVERLAKRLPVKRSRG